MGTAVRRLSELEIAVIDFERGWWLERGAEAKRSAIRRCLGIGPTTYWNVLDRLIDVPAAYRYDPLLVLRLRRRRDERRRARFVTEAPRQRRPH